MTRDRGCRDILCAAIFLAFLAGMGYCTYHAFETGNISKLTAPMDGQHHFCGFGEGKQWPKLYLANLATADALAIMRSGVCVKECPKKKGIQLKCNTKGNHSYGKKCPKSTVATRDWYDFCLPTKKAIKNSKGFKKGVAALQNAVKNSSAGAALLDMWKAS